MQKQEKDQSNRITECLKVLTKLEGELKIPKSNPSIQLLRKRMATYWKEGKTQEERIPLVNSNRHIIYKFPRWAHQEVEVTLRVNKIRNPAIPADLEEELSRPEPTPLLSQSQADAKPHQPLPSDPAVAPPSGTSSETQSGPSHPSQPE